MKKDVISQVPRGTWSRKLASGAHGSGAR